MLFILSNKYQIIYMRLLNIIAISELGIFRVKNVFFTSFNKM